MLRTILIYGVIGGLIAGVAISVVVLVLGIHSYSSGYLSMLVGLSTIFVAIKRRRDMDQGGVIRFWPALGLGLGISLVAGILYTLTWEGAQMVLGTAFDIDKYAAAELKGLNGAALAAKTAEMQALVANYHNPLFRLPMTFVEIFPVGVLVSLVSAGLLCNSRFLPARASGGQA
ncbi:DUF4199 domain-containing protein [Sphingomonas sp. JC676]|uniref:DUF4199 domain-containing protein n=1 Tax=Sphingomonas sp. JC676 TaxID=2768065 RepID=UPI00165768F2|nr:DUF4199 domain-containing protein [Sphingomonas sp. JC676]MBC9034060.1 DUF4199 domain-containing protein [Sphingomonas sp. JC676]